MAGLDLMLGQAEHANLTHFTQHDCIGRWFSHGLFAQPEGCCPFLLEVTPQTTIGHTEGLTRCPQSRDFLFGTLLHLSGAELGHTHGLCCLSQHLLHIAASQPAAAAHSHNRSHNLLANTQRARPSVPQAHSCCAVWKQQLGEAKRNEEPAADAAGSQVAVLCGSSSEAQRTEEPAAIDVAAGRDGAAAGL